MKRIGLIIIFALLFSMFSFAWALPELPEEISKKHDGYIVKVKDTQGPRLFENVLGELESVYSAASLYRADNPEQIKNLEKYGLVEYVEPNYIVELFAPVNDPLYDRQWNIKELGVESAWDAGLYGEGVKIAVIDSGLNTSHEEFNSVDIADGEDFMNGSADVTDYNGHGSFITGLIAAASDNGRGIAGITDKVTIIPLKCFSSTNETSVDYVISAVYRAVDHYGADIINLSLGLSNNLRSFRAAIDHAEKNNVIVVSAVGNAYSTTLMYPAAYDSVIGVGSVSQNGSHSPFSHINGSVFVVAPGESLISLGFESNRAYSEGSGTSYATPHIAAMAAMALDYNRSLTAAQFRDILASTADDLGMSGYDEYFGYGRVNIKSFLAELFTYGTGNTAPAALGHLHSAQAKYDEDALPVTIDMDGWFHDEEGDALSYGVYSSTASGDIKLQGSTLSFVPNSADADKSVRIVVEADDGELKSEKNAILSVSVSSGNIESDEIDKFADLMGHWASKCVAFAVNAGLMNGMDEAHFAPDTALSRAMFVTILGRLSGESIAGYSHSFTDVGPGWYSDSVAWASSRGIVSGTQAGAFSPEMNVSRQQIAVFLYRYAILSRYTDGSARYGVYYGYDDTDSIADWAEAAMLWAVSSGIINGKTSSTLDPEGSATRAEAAAILLRFMNTFVI